MPDLRTISDVEIARTGTYRLSTGEHTFTRSQLAAAVANAQAGQAPRIGIGHVDKRFDGEPAFGTVANLRLADDGDTLLGDFTGVPAWLADRLSSAYPGRSLEASVQGDDLRISAVKLLGITRPGITSLKDLVQHLSDEGPLTVAAGEDADGHFIEVVIASTQEAAQKVGDTFADPTGAEPRPDPPTPKEGSRVDPKQLRESLGLAEDASDEDVIARAAELKARPEKVEDVVPAAEVDQKVQEAVAAARAEERDRIAASGAKVIDAAELDGLKADAQAGREAREKQIAASRESFIDTAVKAGKFPPARRGHYLSLMAADEDGTREFIDTLEAGAIPVAELGAAGDDSTTPTIDTTGWFPQLAGKES